MIEDKKYGGVEAEAAADDADKHQEDEASSDAAAPAAKRAKVDSPAIG